MVKRRGIKSKNKTTRDWFNRWSNEYDNTLGKISFHRELLDLMVKNSSVRGGDRILDIGCGTGLLSLKFLQKADCGVTGIDLSKEMMAIFEDKINKLGLGGRVRLKEMDAESLGFDEGTFDLAVSSVVLHHVKDKLPALKKIFKVLKPGGRLMIGEVDMDTTGSHSDVKRLKRIVDVLVQEWVPALKDVGVKAFARMYDNGKKHILNDGEYCVGLEQWAGLCRKAGFGPITIKRVPRQRAFGTVIATKPVR
ncbi:MAG: class I SAM-dependent methyltransferase [Candidatus Omnitrophota bacterium]|jgi:ubiquinone/menaquinone biosynthesis C-methylase UbiE